MGAYHMWEKSGWCNRCIMVRDFSNSTDQPDEIALNFCQVFRPALAGKSLETEDSFKW